MEQRIGIERMEEAVNLFSYSYLTGFQVSADLQEPFFSYVHNL